MLLALETAIDGLLKSELPSLFSGAGSATATFANQAWDFDRLSADPVAGEPGPQDAVDDLPLNPAAPAGPYLLTRPPYPGAKRVYLRSASGELVALGHSEVVWNPADAASFSLAPRAGRDLAGFDHVHILYAVVAAATHLKTRHKLSLLVAAADAPAAERASTLALAVIVMHRETLLRAGDFAWTANGYQAAGSIKSLKFSAGAAPTGAQRSLSLEAEVELRLERLLEEDEGRPIRHILSPGRAPGSKPIDVNPAVES
jgi:hypothetical protein